MRYILVSGLLAVASFVLSGCAPVFSDLQSAKLVGKGEYEFTPSVTEINFSNEGESEKIQTHMGLQAAYGLFEDTDIRIRYERITMDLDGPDEWVCNVIGIGPKIELTKDRSAFYLPVGFAYGDNIAETSKTWEIHPTLLFTIPMGDNLEINPSAKALMPLSSDNSDILFALNLGAGLSTDHDKWVIRPEFGYLFNPDSDGHFNHFSIGLTLYP
jgi:hypothetical protein